MTTCAQAATRAGARRRAGWAFWLAATCLVQVPAHAGAMHKCVSNGNTVYQDKPCPPEPRAAGASQPSDHVKELERKLDRLQAQGKGLVQRQPPGLPVPSPDAATALPPRQAGAPARGQAAARVEPARSTDKTRDICGGRLEGLPAVGMQDTFFRNCTTHIRFGALTQVVVSEDGDVPLRLYVFASHEASRVYSIGGVITTVLP